MVETKTPDWSASSVAGTAKAVTEAVTPEDVLECRLTQRSDVVASTRSHKATLLILVNKSDRIVAATTKANKPFQLSALMCETKNNT